MICCEVLVYERLVASLVERAEVKTKGILAFSSSGTPQSAVIHLVVTSENSAINVTDNQTDITYSRHPFHHIKSLSCLCVFDQIRIRFLICNPVVKVFNLPKIYLECFSYLSDSAIRTLSGQPAWPVANSNILLVLITDHFWLRLAAPKKAKSNCRCCKSWASWSE